ncbi:MAG: DNA/RNA nuclease SfsA [Solirubrobacterales bacterium]
MLITERIVKAKFIHRPNRFIAYVDIQGEEVVVHVPNTGRCREILIPGTDVVLREGKNENRKTKYDLVAAYKNEKIISIDSLIPNSVVEEALKNKIIGELSSFNHLQREKTFGKSRFDFKLSDDEDNIYYLEVKGVTLEKDSIAMFPDAPTERGTKHLLELIDVKKELGGAGVLFLIQMREVDSFTPNDDMDKHFGKALREAHENGVDIFAYNCDVGENYISILHRVPVLL